MSKGQLGGIAVAVTVLVAVGLLIWRLEAAAFDASPLLTGVYAVTGAPTGYDPLTEQELAAVTQAALGAPAVRAATAGADVTPPEVLLVERHAAGKAAYGKGSWPRQGDVYLYDYATDTLIHTTVDVQSGDVITVERVQGVQLPLTAQEEQRALALVAADTNLWADVTARYQHITGEALTTLAQLQVKVSVFHADVMPARVNVAAQACGQHRCAQVLLFTTEKTLLELTPIVDLSQGQVVQVLEAALHE